MIGYALMVAGLAGLVLSHAVLSSAPGVVAAQALAVGLMLWARVTFGRRSFHVAAAPTEGGLVTSGPYAWIRHPIYAAVCLFGWACTVGHLSVRSVALSCAVSAGAAIRMVAEEKLLRARYPEYVDYARRTKRVFPFVL